MNKRQTLLQLAEALSAGGTKLRRARLWLVLRLLDGPEPATRVLAEAAEFGFSKTTLRRAGRGIMKHEKSRTFGSGHWQWELYSRLETFGVNESREELERRLLALCE